MMNRKRKKMFDKKRIMAVLLVLTVFSCLTGCGNTNTTSKVTSTSSTKIYDGQTVIRTKQGSWTPPRGSRRLQDGNIVDSEGVVIGNDGTWRDDGRGVG
jgi:uncharacterized protein YceK